MVMSWKDKLLDKKKKLQEQYNRGKEVTLQMKAEKLRKRGKTMSSITPGTIRYGIAHKQNPLDLMKDAKCRRERRRKEKEEKH